MIYGVRRLLHGYERVYKAKGEISENLMALMLLLVLISALCSEYLGIHLLFGAFLMGAIMPKQRHFVRYVLDRFETITVTLLLPLFFAFTGLRTNIGLVKGPQMWMYCGLIILVATTGKLGGSMLALVPHRHALPGSSWPRDPDEYARPDGIGHPQHRVGHWRDFASAIFDDGHHGAGHDLHDDTAVASDLLQGTRGKRRARATACIHQVACFYDGRSLVGFSTSSRQISSSSKDGLFLASGSEGATSPQRRDACAAS